MVWLLWGLASLAACGSSHEAGGSTSQGGSDPGTGGRLSLGGAGASNAESGGTSSPVSGGRAPTHGGTLSSAGAPTHGGTPTSGGVHSSAGAPARGGAPGGTGAPRAVDCYRDGDGKTTLGFVNGCANAITYLGSDIQSGVLAAGTFACVDVGNATEPISSKRYWGFAGADPGAEHHTLAEFTFNTDFNDFDWYNISHVDAHNLPMQIVPVARDNCKSLTCAQDFLQGCPEVGRFEDGSGQVVACVSPERDNGESPVAKYFESCDDAYAWSADDQKGSDPSPMRACAGEDWQIVFCPEAP